MLEGVGVTARVGEGLTVGGFRYYAITLLSGIIGCMQSRYLPTGDMSAGDLRVEIPLANNNDGVTTSLTDTIAGSKTWTISDVELMLEYVELKDQMSRAHLRYVLTGKIMPWIDKLITYISEPQNNEDPESYSKSYSAGGTEQAEQELVRKTTKRQNKSSYLTRNTNNTQHTPK